MDLRRVSLICVVAVMAGVPMASHAQQGPATRMPQPVVVTVPFVGCKSDGQMGPVDAPSGKTATTTLSREVAQTLSYYAAAQGIGVLAPRGWKCFGTYGSGGETLFVSPEQIDAKNVFSTGPGIQDTAIIVAYRYGGTSGRFSVAEVIARVFPAYRQFAVRVMHELETKESFVFGPYPTDTLTYRSKATVEFRTPPWKVGLGTFSGLQMSKNQTAGAALLVCPDTDLVLLSVRLPSERNGIAAEVIRKLESDAAQHSCN